MRNNSARVFPKWKPHKYGFMVLLVKLIVWHGYICISHPGRTSAYATTGNSSLTFNGSTSNAVFQRTIAGNVSSMQFSIRTRSSDGLILASSTNNTHFIAIGLNGGKVELVYRHWFMGMEKRIRGVTTIDDGKWYSINVTSSMVSTSIAVNQTADEGTTNTSVLGDHFGASVNGANITVGYNSKQYIASLFTASYFKGCFDKLYLGSDLLKNISSRQVSNGCQSDDTCLSNPCVNGTCVDTFNSYKCNCSIFYSGVDCNLTHNVSCAFKPNLCSFGVCQNLLTPVEPGYSQSGKDYFRCNCNEGYSGYLCDEIVPNLCDPNPCNNGSCSSSSGSYTCNCNSGFTGSNCTVNIDDCSNSPCKNGGTCIDQTNNFFCRCPSGYTGDACETSESSTNVGMWVGIGVAIFVVILLVLFLVVRHCMGSSGLSGTYSPTGQEKGQVQMTSMPPIPPKERLI